MDNQDLLRSINRKKVPKWIYGIGIIIIALLIATLIFLFMRNDDENELGNSSDVKIDTSLVEEGEEDPENQEVTSEEGVVIDANELIVGDERVNAIDVSKWQGKIDWNKVKESGVEAALRRLGKCANINKVQPHRFRRTMATEAINRGMPIEQVQKLLGHAKIDTTMRYAQVDQQNVKISHRKYLG